ncbi:MAG: hypothetical protein U5Q44_03100 [Dehalococcoidia bacterium]|nr:hypothetical protein [Dehalococcoidia bacterium]
MGSADRAGTHRVLADRDRALREQKGTGGLLSRAAASLWDEDRDDSAGDEAPRGAERPAA